MQHLVWCPASTTEHKPNSRQYVRESIQAPQTATVATNSTMDPDWQNGQGWCWNYLWTAYHARYGHVLHFLSRHTHPSVSKISTIPKPGLVTPLPCLPPLRHHICCGAQTCFLLYWGGEVLYSLQCFLLCNVLKLWSLEPILSLFYSEETIRSIPYNQLDYKIHIQNEFRSIFTTSNMYCT